MKFITVQEAIEHVQSENRIFVHGAASTPNTLIRELVAQASRLRDVEICHLHTHGEAAYAQEAHYQSFKINNFFIGANVRPTLGKVRNQYIPIFLSEIPLLFKKKILPLDVAFIHVSPPDKHGFCSLGLSIDATRTAIEYAKIIIAQVNPKMPRSHGDGIIHESKIHYAVQTNDDIPEDRPEELSPEELSIGRHVAGIINDGACLQLGIGGIPNAVLACLGNHKDLGIHSEMFSDGVLPLVESGVINGRKKKTHPGKIVTTFAIGSRKLYDFIDDNPMIAMLDVAYTNATNVIRKNPQVTAINSAIEIDLTGQVCADSIGHRMFSGVGGQMDFIRGASLSEGGKPIIAMTATTKKGQSKIVPFLKEGAGVVSTRAHIHHIATEYGIVDLYGKNLAQRAKALISIAHPDFREELSKQAYEVYGNLDF
jgi:acyl-CoA hydrolase